MNEKMTMCLQEAQTADGQTVRIISHFCEKSIDPEATKAVVTPLLLETPEYAKIQSVQAKIQAQNKIAAEAWQLADKARNAVDAKNEAAHTAAFTAANSAISVMVDEELEPSVKELEAARDRLYMENRQYSLCGPHQCCCNGRYETLKAKFDALGEHERLTNEGEVIPDWRGVEYWRKTGGKWVKDKIEFIGEAPPKGAVLQENITPEIQAEIAEQREAERIAAMPPEDRAKAKQAALDALADEADRLDRRSKIQRKAFDPIAYYDEHAKAVEAKYA